MRRVAKGCNEGVRQVLARALMALALVMGSATAGSAFETAAPTAIMTDFETGTVLFEKDSDRAVPPASLVKLMTVAVIFHELEEGRLSLGDRFTVSENAWRTGGAASGGSTMFLPLNSEVTLGDLIKGIIIQSGNDATIVAAEGIAGSVEGFAAMMNARAEEIGLTGSAFTNPHGLPDPGQHVTMRDLAVLATHLIREHPEHYPLFSEEEFTFNDITQRSRNPLLGLGADGLKTGHTSEAGYGLVASAEEDGRRIVLAMNGMQSTNERAEEAGKMMSWGLRSFAEVVLLPAGQPAGEARVLGGVAPVVPLVAREDARVLAPRGSESEYATVLVGNDAVAAPVAEGDPIGTLRITRGEETVGEIPLHAAGAVAEASYFQQAWDQVANALDGMWTKVTSFVW